MAKKSVFPFVYKISIDWAIDDKLNGMTLREKLKEMAWGELYNQSLADGMYDMFELEDLESELKIAIQWDKDQFIVTIG